MNEAKAAILTKSVSSLPDRVNSENWRVEARSERFLMQKFIILTSPDSINQSCAGEVVWSRHVGKNAAQQFLGPFLWQKFRKKRAKHSSGEGIVLFKYDICDDSAILN